MPGPATVTVHLRTQGKGELGVAWRLSDQKDFVAGNQVSQRIEAGAAWQSVALALPTEGNIVHLRVLLPGDGAEIQRIEVSGPGGTQKEWSFK